MKGKRQTWEQPEAEVTSLNHRILLVEEELATALQKPKEEERKLLMRVREV